MDEQSPPLASAPPSAPPGGGVSPVPAPVRYETDAAGRRYPVDEFGMRIRKSTRPPGFPSADWNRLNAKQKAKVVADYHQNLAPDVAAMVADPDADFHAIGDRVRKFEDSME